MSPLTTESTVGMARIRVSQELMASHPTPQEGLQRWTGGKVEPAPDGNAISGQHELSARRTAAKAFPSQVAQDSQLNVWFIILSEFMYENRQVVIARFLW